MNDTGVCVDTALSGEDALLMLQDESRDTNYDVILLDWKLPAMNGIGTADRLRRLIPDSVPILFLYDGDEMPEELHSIQNAGFLAKPFFVSAFKEALLKIQSKSTVQTFMPESDEESLRGLHFLVAEDNDINAEILSELLDIEKATCEIAENGQLALERFTSAAMNEFDAILMDVQMPVMNGYEATRRIRELKRPDALNIPIIAMTANAFAEDVKEALDAGMNAHIAKPIDMELLKKTIKQSIHYRPT